MDLNDVREMAGRQGSLYFAFFTADWCAPCRWMEEQAFQDDRLAEYVQRRYLAVRVDIDQREGRVHQERYQVKLLPSILVFNAQGQLLARIETAIAPEELLSILKEYDLPKNQVGSANSALSPNVAVMDSPKPVIRLYRPPLPSENAAPPPVPVTGAPAMTMPSESTLAAAPSVPVFRPTRETMAPRSGKAFSIHVGTYENYNQAVSQARQLEAGFKEPVRLLGATSRTGKQVYRVFIGMFPDKPAADNYLYYLRRKNMNGAIWEEK